MSKSNEEINREEDESPRQFTDRYTFSSGGSMCQPLICIIKVVN